MLLALKAHLGRQTPASTILRFGLGRPLLKQFTAHSQDLY
jgi:hypothetical protein